MSTETINELQRALGRVEGKLDDFLNTMNDHDSRIGRLERWKAYILGAAAASGVFLGAVWKIVAR
jgi:hypothetical protein